MMHRLSYTYLVYETNRGAEGLKYIGSRLCPAGKTPWTDTKYMGSPVSKKNRAFKQNKHKEKMILGVFYTHEDAIAHEIYLHRLYKVDTNPEFANQARQTSTGFVRSGPLSKEERQNLSESRKGENNPFYGKTHSPESIQKLSEALKGRTFSEETLNKISEALKGRVFSEEHRQNISRANVGKTHTEETRRKQSESKKGEKHPMYGKTRREESRRKQSESRKGKYTGENNPFYGKTHSEESLNIQSEAKRGRNNPRFDHTLRDWINEDGALELQITSYDLRQKYKELQHANLSKVIKGKAKSYKGWSLVD